MKSFVGATRGYLITAKNFSANSRLLPPVIATVDLAISPLGLTLVGVKIVTTPRAGFCISIPHTFTVIGGELLRKPDGAAAKKAAVAFDNRDDWRVFVNVAVAAIQESFPGAMQRAFDSVSRAA